MHPVRLFYGAWLICMGALFLVGCGSMTSDAPGAEIDAFVAPAQAQTEAILRVQPPTQQLAGGSTAVVEIWIDNIADLTAADMTVQFDPAVLQVQDADPGQEGVQIQPGNFPSPDLVARNVATNTIGLVQYAVVQLPPSQPVSGSGILAKIEFLAGGVGVSQLNLTAQLANSQAQLIPVTLQPGQIIVETSSSSTATPSATVTGQPTTTPTLTPPTPTQTPSPTATPTFTVTPIPPTPTITPTPTQTPVSLPAEIPPGATIGFCHRVQAGESLESLGQRFGINPSMIQVANDLYPPGYVYPQQALFIPEQRGGGPNFYRIKDGDTLADIANRCHLPVDFLAWVNDIDQTAALQSGQVLEIPIPPFPPPSRYPHPPAGPPSTYPPLFRPW